MLGKQLKACICTMEQESYYELIWCQCCFVTCLGLQQEFCLAAKAARGPDQEQDPHCDLSLSLSISSRSFYTTAFSKLGEETVPLLKDSLWYSMLFKHGFISMRIVTGHLDCAKL